MKELPTGTVTLLFTDIEGSTRLLQRAGDAYPSLLDEHRRVLRAAFSSHDGVEVDAQGDAFFVAFASAQDAAAAAVAAQQALAGHDWPDNREIRVRIGLHTGEPTAVGGRYVGLAVHQGARVMAAGHGGQVLVSESTRALLDDRFQARDLGEHRLKDLAGPHHLYQLLVEGLPADFPPLKTLENRPTNLPVLANALIGRSRELKETQALLARDEVRLLTLTGAGGTGKTRFALQIAAEQLEEFANGVFFVSLAPIRDWELVVPTIAQTLGLREQPGETRLETLTEYLRDKQLLLLLDNFEQVVPAAPEISGLLAAAPEINVLVTSRTRLRLSGERTYPVPPLELPNPEQLVDAGALMEYEAVRLFVERAQAATSDFAVTDVNVQAVAEICIRLDGLPLAIELAAPRVRALPAPALLRRLDQRLRLLTGGAQDVDERQRTLRATLEWSYDLLLDSEKVVFAELGTFIGGCRLEAAEAVCDPRGELGLELLGSLESLVEKSLLLQRADPDGEPRFWMLETIREFAIDLSQTRAALPTLARDTRLTSARWLRTSTSSRGRATKQFSSAGWTPRPRTSGLHSSGRGRVKTRSCCWVWPPPSGASGRREATSPRGEAPSRTRWRSVASDQHVRCSVSAPCGSLAAVRTRFSMTRKRPSRPASSSVTTTASRKPGTCLAASTPSSARWRRENAPGGRRCRTPSVEVTQPRRPKASPGS